MNDDAYPNDDYPDDPEWFCGKCLAGLRISEHYERCAD